jgi:hypothetical protein
MVTRPGISSTRFRRGRRRPRNRIEVQPGGMVLDGRRRHLGQPLAIWLATPSRLPPRGLVQDTCHPPSSHVSPDVVVVVVFFVGHITPPPYQWCGVVWCGVLGMREMREMREKEEERERGQQGVSLT